MSLQTSDAESEAHAVAPRVRLTDIEAAIAETHYTTGRQLCSVTQPAPYPGHPADVLTVCLLVMRNGFTVIGKSAPASPENFNAEFGRKLAYEDCIRQLWPLMGFALREKLAAA